MKRILFSIISMSGGGAQRVVSVWASQLAEKGYDVGILTYARKEGEYAVNDKVKRFVVTKNAKDFSAMNYLKRCKLMRKRVKEFAPDVVISFLQAIQICIS